MSWREGKQKKWKESEGVTEARFEAVQVFDQYSVGDVIFAQKRVE